MWRLTKHRLDLLLSRSGNSSDYPFDVFVNQRRFVCRLHSIKPRPNFLIFSRTSGQTLRRIESKNSLKKKKKLVKGWSIVAAAVNPHQKPDYSSLGGFLSRHTYTSRSWPTSILSTTAARPMFTEPRISGSRINADGFSTAARVQIIYPLIAVLVDAYIRRLNERP